MEIPLRLFWCDQALKLTQSGKVHCWSFQTLQCVAVKTSQFGLNFGHAFVWQVMRRRPVTTLAAALPPSRPFPGVRHGAQVPKRTLQLYSTAYNNSFHVPDVRDVFYVRPNGAQCVHSRRLVRTRESYNIVRLPGWYGERVLFITTLSCAVHVRLPIGRCHEIDHPPPCRIIPHSLTAQSSA